MKNQLSEIYKNENVLLQNTNQKYCVVKDQIGWDDIDRLFSNKEDFCRSRIKIMTADKEYDTYLSGRGNHYLITIHNEKIDLSDIISFEIL